MSNNDIYNSLNCFTRNFINDYISIYMHLLKSNSIEDINLINYIALFLATLKDDNITSSFFKKYGITYENFVEKYKDLNLDKIESIDIDFTSITSKIDLNKIFSRLIFKTKMICYIDEDFSYDIIKTYQIFDSQIDEMKEYLSNLLANYYGDTTSDLFDKYEDYIYNFYYEFARDNFGINIDEKEKNNYKEYDFDECKIEIRNGLVYLTLKENANLDKMIFHINRSYKKENNSSSERKEKFIKNTNLPKTFLINRIDSFRIITKEILDNLLLNPNGSITKIPFEISNIDTNEKQVVWFDSKYTFGISNEQVKASDSMEKDVRVYTPYLDKYGIDLTQEHYIKDPSIGRDSDIKRIEQILCYPERDKSVIITGVAGSGKTALVKGLAYRIQNNDVPRSLKDLRIISVDSASLVSGCRYVGMLEERMKGILDEASSSKNIIIFMDEIHQALGAGKAENDPNSVSEMLKPYLDYGKVRLIGATTTKEYLEFVEKDDAFKTRFKKVTIDEPNDNIIYQILDDLINTYNNFGEKTDMYCPKLNLNNQERDLIIKWLIESTRPNFRTYNDRASNPRLVLDIIKEAYAIAAINDLDEVSIDNIKEALLLETRLYESSKKRQIEILEESLLRTIPEKKSTIIDFNLIKKKPLK